MYRVVFAAAAAYNIVFGLWAALFPRAFFTMFHLDAPRYPAIWACLGMVVGLYGVGYAYAAWRPERGAPFIAIGLAGKILGPIGWVMAVHSGELPFRTFPLLVFDDLMWWLPFAMFLLDRTAIVDFLKRTAPYWCATFHTIAAIGAVILLREGPARWEMWRAGWLLWMLSAVSLLGFYACWGARAARTLAMIGFAIAAAGLFCDFAGESILIAWLPRAEDPLYRIAALLSAGAGNGLYTIGGIVLTIASPLPALLRAWAWVIWAAGISMTLLTIADSATGIVIASIVLMVLFVPWVVLVGVKLR
ncbi:MAG TPA: hypothetical protein VLV78_11045 [Thermoanaerobaculia bacterium]|nr:hypothetical protein [Thermoanaerobaculia bacterium]